MFVVDVYYVFVVVVTVCLLLMFTMCLLWMLWYHIHTCIHMMFCSSTN